MNIKSKIKNKTFKKNIKSRKVRKFKKSKKKYKKGGTSIYYMNTDEVKYSNLTYNGLPFFRKVYNNPPDNEEQKYLKKLKWQLLKY